MNGLGTLGMRHVALSNGSGVGTLVENNITAGLPFMELKGQKIVCETTQSGIILCGDVNFNITLRATGNNILTEVFHGFIEKNEPLGSMSTESTVNWNTKAYDVSPGGTSNLGVAPLGTVPGGLMSSLIAAGVTTSGGLTATHHCFIPSFSSVFATTPTNFTSPQTCGVVSRCTQSATATVTSYGGIPEINQPHIALDARIANLLIDELVTMSPPPVNVLSALPNNTLNQYFNVGLDIHSSIPTLSVASSNGKLQINNTGLIAFATGNEPTSAQNSFTAFLKCEAILRVEDKARLKIGADGGSKHGILIAPNGSTVHVKSGGTLHITSGESMLIIQSGATLILDKDARIQLDNPESKIRIEGTLQINGDIKFGGEGYFEFASGNQLSIHSDNNTFKLSGMGNENRFVRIDDFAEINVPEGKHLEWSRGRIIYGDGAALNFAEKSDGVFLVVDFIAKYNAGAFGIHAPKSMGNLRVMFCNFVHISFPIIVNGGDGVTYMRETVFTRYDQGTEFNRRQFLDFVTCDWSGYGEDENGNETYGVAHYGLRSYFNGNTRLRDCSIYGHKNKEIDIILVNTDILHANGYTAIEVEGGYLLKIVGGDLSENDFGVVNKEFQDGTGLPTNIFLTNQANINNGHAGIVMKGNKSLGLVMMDCAKIEYVDYCIVGEDIRLVIDPVLLDGGRSNSFLINDDKLGTLYKFIKICYISYTPPSKILARSNSWDWASQGGTIHSVPAPFPQYIETNIVGKGSCIKPQAIAFVECIPTASRKDFCLSTGKVTTDHEFVVDNPTGINVINTVKDGFQKGVDQLREENYPEAKHQFTETANIDPEVPNSEDWPQTKTYLHAAISLSLATEGNFGQSGENRSVKNISGSDVIRPNPTNGLTRIVLPIERKSATVRVWDTFGKLMQELEITESANIDVTAWKSGFYVVEIVGDAKNRALRYKMLVTHL
jgi:hypothetical protein